MYDLLKGLTVVEAAAFIAGPTSGLYLAQFGAEVIRIDTLGGGPDFRRWPLAPSGDSLYWEGLNKGKKSICIDLARPEGRELAQRLATAPGDDRGLFVTNFPVDGFLSYERLKALREDIICVRVMGWADGRPALDYTVNAAVGVPWMTGFADDPRPVNHTFPAWDFITGAYAALSLVSAERGRRMGGGGCEMRIPLSDIAATALANFGHLAEVLMTGHDRPRQGNDVYAAFGRDFVIKGGRRLMVVAITARQWRALLQTLQLEASVAALEAELGVSFATHEAVRYQHRDRLSPLFEAAFALRTAAELAPAFEAAGVCWSEYRTLSEAAKDDSLFAANPVFGRAAQPSGLDYPVPGPAATLTGKTRGAPTPAPRLGADTDAVLAELLGMSSGEIGRLHDAK
ncbi:MAG TPA: CoA transferase, partial [Caulobacteraceae bacterium]|nr:CoA transferase [Caulobacteraceae bacterium]